MKKVQVSVLGGEGLRMRPASRPDWKTVSAAAIGLIFLSGCGRNEEPRQIAQVLPVPVPGHRIVQSVSEDVRNTDLPEEKTVYPIHIVKPDPDLYCPILRVKTECDRRLATEDKPH
jgi:hypothetical protein